MDIEDFPAAHSMDSGWFAVDQHGQLAHFDTGEAGAMPVDVAFATGEAGNDGDAFWLQHVVPWIARNTADTSVFVTLDDVYAVYDSPEHASAVLDAMGERAEVVEDNEHVVAVVWFDEADYAAPFAAAEGFVGFAPTLWALWEDGVAEHVPVHMYEHGDWAIPGQYVRRGAPAAVMPVPEAARGQIASMAVDFAAVSELNLADFYPQEQTHSWSNADLRTGEETARDTLLGKLKRFFEG